MQENLLKSAHKSGAFLYATAQGVKRRAVKWMQPMLTKRRQKGKNMKRKFLEDLGIEKEMIDKIMDENGNDVNRITVERDNYKTQFETAQNTLKGFEGVDVNELQSKIATLNTDLANKDSQWQSKLDELEFNSLLKDTVKGAGARNDKAVMALLDIDTLKNSKNREADIASALEATKKDNAYLFQDTNVPFVVSKTDGPNENLGDKKEQANAAFRSLAGKE